MASFLTTQAWFPADATIKLEKKGDTVQTITTEVTNFSDGGGAKNTENIPHFGNAYLTVKKPQEDFDVEFEVSVSDTTWTEIVSGSTIETAGSFQAIFSDSTQNPYKVKIEWTSPDTNEAYKIIYYNAYGVTFEKESPADDRLTGTISFMISPTNAVGSIQRIEAETIDITHPIYGSALNGAGSGLYGSYESQYDAIHGFGVGSML